MKDLTTVNHTMSSVLSKASKDNTLKKCTSVTSTYEVVSNLFKENEIDTVASNRLLDTIKKSKSFNNAIMAVYNSILKGSGNQVIR